MTMMLFDTFEDARDFGTKNVKGFPAWRVIPYRTAYAIELSPNGPFLRKVSTEEAYIVGGMDTAPIEKFEDD